MQPSKENTPYQGFRQDIVMIYTGMYSTFLYIHELQYHFGRRKMACLVSGHYLTTNATIKCFVV